MARIALQQMAHANERAEVNRRLAVAGIAEWVASLTEEDLAHWRAMGAARMTEPCLLGGDRGHHNCAGRFRDLVGDGAWVSCTCKCHGPDYLLPRFDDDEPAA